MAHHRAWKDQVRPSEAEDRIWRTIDEALAYHQKPGRDLTPTDALNRLFSRHVRHQGLRGMPRLCRETCSATCEAWTADELRSLVRWHCRARPRFEHYPIVVARCGNRAFVLDGNNRTSKWVAENSQWHHAVIVIRPRLPAVPAPVQQWRRLAGWQPAIARLFSFRTIVDLTYR
jgi:hypothetical protein